jgi:hypothetical protein
MVPETVFSCAIREGDKIKSMAKTMIFPRQATLLIVVVLVRW